MHISIARYAGAAGKIGAVAPKVQQGFVPLLKSQRGFLGYAAFTSEQDDIVALHLWENADALASSRGKLHEWIQANLSGFAEPPGASTVKSGRTPSSRRRAAAMASPSTAW